MIAIGKYEINEKEARQKKYKWVAWYSADFAKCAEWHNTAKHFPNIYKDGADKDFAEMAMKNFEELWKLDKDCAEMVGASWGYSIADMMDTLGEDGKRYYAYLTF